MQKLIFLIVFLSLSFTLFAQNRKILTPDGKLHSINEVKRVKVSSKLNPQTKKINPINSINGTIDTLSYNDGTFDTDIVVNGQEWLLQWYQAPTDLFITGLGFYCTANPDDLPAEVKIVKVNWTTDQLQSAGTEWWGYYEALGNGYNDITAFLDNPDRTGGWTAIQPGVTEPFAEDIWSDGGVGFSFIPDETLQDYQWVTLDLFQPSIIAGEIFGVALKNPYPIMGEGTISFLGGIIGVPGWKFYPNGRLDPGIDYGWWTEEYTPDFPVAVVLTGDLPPSINWFTIIPSGIFSGPFIIDANITDTNLGDTTNAGVASARILYSNDAGATWTDILMSGSEPDFTGEIYPQGPGATVSYLIEAIDINGNAAYSPTITFYIFAPSGAPTLVVFNGLIEPDGFPQDYYFGPDIQSGSSAFAHDTWSYGALQEEVVEFYDNIFEFCTTGPSDYNDSVITSWLAADGSRNYFLAGQEWLGAKYDFVDKDFQPGDFEYDILGITHSYNDVSYNGTSGQEIPSLLFAQENTLFGDPIKAAFDATGADSLQYNPVYEIGVDNWIDGFEVIEEQGVDMQVETRGINGTPETDTVACQVHRTLPNGNKIVFLAYDPLSINTAVNSNFSYYELIGYTNSNTPYQTLIWFDIPVGIEEENEKKTIPAEFSLSQNYPNPFNPGTSIQYAVSNRQFVSLKVYDVLGNEVATLINEEKPAGEYEIEFDATDLTSGIYFYQLRTGEFVEIKKMVLLR